MGNTTKQHTLKLYERGVDTARGFALGCSGVVHKQLPFFAIFNGLMQKRSYVGRLYYQ